MRKGFSQILPSDFPLTKDDTLEEIFLFFHVRILNKIFPVFIIKIRTAFLFSLAISGLNSSPYSNGYLMFFLGIVILNLFYYLLIYYYLELEKD
jgi:hypothetical protein